MFREKSVLDERRERGLRWPLAVPAGDVTRGLQRALQ
jgi:hypothetical protein